MLCAPMASTQDGLPTTIIKSDRTGRPRYTQQYRDEVLAAYEASGMGGPAFARHCGLKYPTFAGWAARRRREGGNAKAPAHTRQFALAEFDTAPAPAVSGEVLVEFPGGASARLADKSQVELLATLIGALAR